MSIAPSLIKRFTKRLIGYMPYILCFCVLLMSDTFSSFVSINGLAQLILFVLVVCIPAYITKRMSYVDIGWPWGLVLIGVMTLILGEGYDIRKYIVAGMYIFTGLRMGGGALLLLKKGHLNTELNRYQYQRRRWAKGGYTNDDLSMQYEVLMQGIANVTFLALPAMLQAFNPQGSISAFEIIGYIIWALSFVMEHTADRQKLDFLKKMKKAKKKNQVCNIGLWKYTRHPNYFAEWMVWNGFIISSISSLIYFYTVEKLWIWGGLLMGLLFISRVMYLTLVYFTGAVPSEYYSLQKRPNYAEYKRTTNMFFPGRPKS